MADTQWSIYIVRNRLGSLYTGITTDVERRFNQHQNGTGAKALRGKGPYYHWSFIAKLAIGNKRLNLNIV